MKKNSSKVILVLVVLIVLLINGCTKQKNEIEKDEILNVEQIKIEQNTMEKTVMGDILETPLIENFEGNYEIPLPSGWVGNVSYAFDNTKTTIYHITKDHDEFELYPVLLQIETGKSGENLDIEPFLDIGGISYYSIPRFDFPYNEGSKDAIEFELLFEDIPLVLQSFWLIDASAWDEEMPREIIAQTKPVGTVVDEQTIKVKSGLYSVVVPVEWIRKTSYKTSGNILTFYHITIDPDELEISPVIIEIDVADGVMESGVEETFAKDGYTFYYTPRFDFPYYDSDSDDGKQFAMLTEELQNVLASCSLN